MGHAAQMNGSGSRAVAPRRPNSGRRPGADLYERLIGRE
jgi:hypothetical protein